MINGDVELSSQEHSKIGNILNKIKTLFNFAYIHVAAILGALSLLSFLNSLLEIQGFIDPLLHWWQELTRPAAELLLRPIIMILHWITGFDIQIPLLAKDYFSVGIVLILSRVRGIIGGWKGGISKAWNWAKSTPKAPMAIFVSTVLLWPYELLRMLLISAVPKRIFPNRLTEIKEIREAHLYAALPAIYAAIMFTIEVVYVLN